VVRGGLVLRLRGLRLCRLGEHHAELARHAGAESAVHSGMGNAMSCLLRELRLGSGQGHWQNQLKTLRVKYRHYPDQAGRPMRNATAMPARRETIAPVHHQPEEGRVKKQPDHEYARQKRHFHASLFGSCQQSNSWPPAGSSALRINLLHKGVIRLVDPPVRTRPPTVAPRFDSGPHACRCGGAGMPCPKCNPSSGRDDPPRLPRGLKSDGE
jgi:hypothetical protein